MTRLSTITLLERAFHNEVQTFHALITSLSEEEAIEVAFFLTSKKVAMPAHSSKETPDKILLVANNIVSISNALDSSYVP
jgi:hypothetical protein